MKKLVLLLGLSMSLVGCSNSDRIVYTPGSTETVQQSNRFQSTGNIYYIYGYDWKEILDTQTGNLYVTRAGGNSPSELSPLYNEERNIENINDK